MIDYIDGGAASGKPFLASINFLANHIPVQAPDSDIARYAAMYHDGWTALREARAKRAAALGIMPENAPIVMMATTPDWSTLSATERTAAARVMQAYAAMATELDRATGRPAAPLKAHGQDHTTTARGPVRKKR